MTANHKTTWEFEDGHTRKIADEIVESGENEAGTKQDGANG